MSLLGEWRVLREVQKLLSSQGQLKAFAPSNHLPLQNQNPGVSLNQSQLLSLGHQGLKLDHINDVAPSPGRMVVASGKPLRHMDYFSGKHFVLETRGIRLDSWKLNPQMWWMHDSNIPLGTSDLALEADGRLVADNIRFHRQKISVAGWSLGEFDTGIIADLYEAGVLRASSVQVMFTNDDITRVYETEENVVIPTSELIEWSLVTAPADREAVRLSLGGLGVNDQIAHLILGEAARENSRPVAITSPAQTENTMNELELTEDDVKALALEIAAALLADTDFMASVANAVASSATLQDTVTNAIAAAAPQSHVMQAETPVATDAPATSGTLRLRIAKQAEAAATATQQTPAAATKKIPVNRANLPTPRTVALAHMVRAKN